MSALSCELISVRRLLLPYEQVEPVKRKDKPAIGSSSAIGAEFSVDLGLTEWFEICHCSHAAPGFGQDLEDVESFTVSHA